MHWPAVLSLACAARKQACSVALSFARSSCSLAHALRGVRGVRCVLCAQFEWRNGWFYEITQEAMAAGRPDPMPLHTAGLKELGVIS